MDEGDTSSDGEGSVIVDASIPISNQFDGLEDEQGGDQNSLPSIPTAPPVLKIGEPTKAKKVRIPPISVVGKSTRQLREFLGKSNIAQTAYNMKATKSGVQLLCSGDDSFRGAVRALRTANIEFHTYTPAAEQPMKVVLSGLPVYDVDELETELAGLGIHVSELKLFSRKVVGMEESALYLLHFPKAELRNVQPPTLRPFRNTVPQNGNTVPHHGNPGNNSTADTSAMTFAEALSQGNSNNSNSNLFTMSEFLTLAREVFARLKSCKSRQDQLEALVELTAKYIYNV
ncbi:hypothetical protein pipiens_010922 [Culex pipiens pipiens]|uniref:Uncharacterized protein n=1 Tax=Culex pipiens pipiens TaxID=38569 RepID=A0ABD1D944_CULPP